MRGPVIVVIAILVPGAVFGQQQGSKYPKQDNCFYTVGIESIQVPMGKTVCRRQPAPYDDKYSLLRCIPPLDEVDSDIKRNDARCDRYEDRQ
jgi:hypothetical protein